MTTKKTLSKKEVIEAIQKEIDWCKKNKEKSSGYDFADAFIKGLKQAIYLVRELKISEK
jgi:5'-3' exonuclease